MKKRLTLSVAPAGNASSNRLARSRAGDLLRKVVQCGALTVGDVADSLCLQPDAVEQLLGGTKVMSLPHQLCFATLLLERVPRFVRSAHTLRAQTLAAIAFSERQTKTHSGPPATWRALRLL
jgi:hypothetical protein